MKYIHGKVLQVQFEKGWGGLPNYLDKIEKPKNKQQLKINSLDSRQLKIEI